MHSPLKTLAPFLDSLEEGVLFLDKQRRLVSINQAASTMIGQSSQLLIGKLCPSLFKGTACAKACAKRDDCTLLPTQDQSTQTLELALDREDGSQLFLRMWAILLPEEEQSAFVAVILRDRTREVLLEEEISERLRLGKMVGHGPSMRTLFQKILRAAVSEATVLIVGESGTGKELVARALHDNSNRFRGPYIRIHCAAFPENLLESELFGHAKGAFTGADSARIGRFEAAHGGTLLLDEIGEISPTIQVKLLRVLQEREIERLGENKTRQVDVRVLAATNQDLATMVQEKRFREDLFYRLKVVPIQVPPLRSRTEDISLLAQTLLGEMGQRYGREGVRLSEEAIILMMSYSWPGNVRELGNALEYALVQGDGDIILPHHLPEELSLTPIQSIQVLPIAPQQKTTGYYQKPDDTLEKMLIMQTLQETQGNKVMAAKKLGMSRTTLWKRLKK